MSNGESELTVLGAVKFEETALAAQPVKSIFHSQLPFSLHDTTNTTVLSNNAQVYSSDLVNGSFSPQFLMWISAKLLSRNSPRCFDFSFHG